MRRLISQAARRFTPSVLLLCGLLLAACTDSSSRQIHLLTGAHPAELARTHLVGAVLREQGFAVTIEEARLGQIWQRLWAGKADASVTVWLPDASAPFVERFFDRLDDLGPKGTALAEESEIWPVNDKPHTVVRRSLEQELPDALLILRSLHWQPEDVTHIMNGWQQSQNWTLAAESWLAAQAASGSVKP